MLPERAWMQPQRCSWWVGKLRGEPWLQPRGRQVVMQEQLVRRLELEHLLQWQSQLFWESRLLVV